MKPREFVRHHYPVRIVFCPNERAWATLLRTLNYEGACPSHRGSCTLLKGDDGATIALTLGGKLSRLEVAAFAAHEAVHVAQYVEEVIAGPLGREPQAYLVQALVSWLVGEYERASRSRGRT